MKKVLGLLLFAFVGIGLMGCEIESTQSQDNQKPVDLSGYVTAELTDDLVIKLDVKFDAIQEKYPHVDSYTYEVMATDVISVLFYDESLEVVGYANATFTTSSLFETFTVTFVVDGVEETRIFEEGIEFEVEEPTHETLIFTGWFLDEEFTIPFTSDTVPGEDMTLYAKFVENRFVITFENDGGIGYSSVAVMYNAPIPKPSDPIKEGFVFLGYFMDEDFEEPMDWDSTMPKHDFTVYAKYETE
jgi:uncharacterized repeat protein (TIGR02543 family)